jgi:hypothetical protein
MVELIHLVGKAIADKLVHVLGFEIASTLATEILADLELDRLDSPDERFQFGQALTARGGIHRILGKAVEAQAILHGAKERVDAARKRRI